jgi:hypothetical protein
MPLCLNAADGPRLRAGPGRVGRSSNVPAPSGHEHLGRDPGRLRGCAPARIVAPEGFPSNTDVGDGVDAHRPALGRTAGSLRRSADAGNIRSRPRRSTARVPHVAGRPCTDRRHRWQEPCNSAITRPGPVPGRLDPGAPGRLAANPLLAPRRPAPRGRRTSGATRPCTPTVPPAVRVGWTARP